MTQPSEHHPAADPAALFRMMYEFMREGVLLLDCEGRVLAANASAQRMLGLSLEQMREQAPHDPAWRLIKEDGSPFTTADRLYPKARDTGQEIRDVTVGVCKGDGSLTWLLVGSRQIQAQDSPWDGSFVTTFTDVTALHAADAAMRENEARFRSTLMHAPIGMAIVSLERRFVEVNAALVRIVGYSAEELLQRTFVDITHPDDIENDLNHLRRLTDGEIDRYAIEKRYLRKDGTTVWAELTVSMLRDAAGQPLYYISQIQDIDERKAVLEALHTARQKLGLVVEAAEIGIWEWDPRTGESTWDAQMYRMFGVDPGTPVTQASWNAMVLPEDMPQALAAMRRALDHKRSTRSQYRIRRPDGNIRHLLIASAPLLDASGRVRKLIGLNFDATQRAMAEKALAHSEKRLRALIDSVPGVITLLDRDMRYQVVNQRVARNFGMPVEAIEGRLMSEILPTGIYEHHVGMAAACLRGQDFEFNDEWVREDKSVEYWHGQYVPFVENGEVTGYVCVALEVGELKKTQVRLTKTIAKLVDKVKEVSDLQAQLREQAVRDGLTGLYNRRYLDATLPRELANASRLGQQISLLMIDIDHFKRINDSFGHDGGDAMLVALADLMQSACREGDLVCRYGGEEFLILLPNMVQEDALRRADEIREAFSGLGVPHDKGTIQSTLSIGVACFPRHAATARDLVRMADAALYSAKGAGRNRVVGYDQENMGTIASMADHP